MKTLRVAAACCSSAAVVLQVANSVPDVLELLLRKSVKYIESRPWTSFQIYFLSFGDYC